MVWPTETVGDLHHRTRLLSLHSRGDFHPAAALARLLDDARGEGDGEGEGEGEGDGMGEGEDEGNEEDKGDEEADSDGKEVGEADGRGEGGCPLPGGSGHLPPGWTRVQSGTRSSGQALHAFVNPANGERVRSIKAAWRMHEQARETARRLAKVKEAKPDRPFAFSTGASETRFGAKGGVSARYDALPAYNSNLNVAIFVRGAYYQLSPWLAGRASALPDAYQKVTAPSGSSSARRGGTKRPLFTNEAIALANMVSPLQGRELGYAIAREWQAPRPMNDVEALADAELVGFQYSSTVASAPPC